MSARVYVTRLRDEANEGSRLLWRLIQRLGSQSALSRKLGIAKGCIGRWLRGEQKPSAVFRLKLSRFGIPVGAWEEPPREPFSLSFHAA